MKFEYDPNKSASNKEKHGIDFEEAQAIWDSSFLVVPLGSGHGEERQAVFGIIGEKHWTAIITPRDENLRIISVRRSRKKEEEFYGSKEKY